MKIAHIVCTFPPYSGGMGNSVYNLARIANDSEHEISVLTPNYGDNEKQPDSGFKIVRVRPWVKSGNAALLPQLLWKTLKFDIIHFHYPFYGATIFVLLAKILRGKKLKLILHYHMDNVGSGLRKIVFDFNYKFILPIMARKSSVILCSTEDYARHSRIAPYIEDSKFQTLPFGVDLEKFKPSGTKNVAPHKSILFVGGLDKAHYFKGVENLIKAVKSLHDRKIDVRLEVVGNGELKAYYQDLAEQLGIRQIVNFAEKINNDELLNYYRNCNVLALPSINAGEAFGIVLIEAMACAKPVIASNLPGVRSVFQNEREGLLVEPGNPQDLANKLAVILTDDAMAEKFGRSGYELVREKYSWQVIGPRLKKIYDQTNR